jgi:RNA polymerase sigma-70 factor, ECF subfamily
MRELSGVPRSNAVDQGSDAAIDPHSCPAGARPPLSYPERSQVLMQNLLEQGQRRRERRLARLQVAVLAAEELAELDEASLSAAHPAAAHPAEVSAEPPDPRAFLQLFQEYERYVASIGNRILGANNGVDDLVQEVFLVIYQEFHKLRELSSVKAWLATITTRLAWRQRGRPWLFSKLSLAQVEELNPLESQDASPELQADLSVLLDRLRAMPQSLREPWLLRFIDGETLPRIAKLCDCSQSTVQRRLREAGEVMLGTRPPSETTPSDPPPNAAAPSD